MVPEQTLRLTLTWGLGGAAVELLCLLFGTGLMLKFVYEPFPDRAYASILYLRDNISFGSLVRNMHRWSANGLVMVAFLHFLRVFYTGAFTEMRRINWFVGLALFAIVVLANFTGYLLPWDQVAYWAITISTSMLDYLPVLGTTMKEWLIGGPEPGSRTLLNFYVIHTAILPALVLLVLPFHFWRIRKAKGLVLPTVAEGEPDPRDDVVESMPHLIMREAAMAMVVLAVILLSAMFFDAPLAEHANPGLSPNPTKAPWYFMGLQEILMHFHPVFALQVIPAFLLAGLFVIPFVKYEAKVSGVWFGSVKAVKLNLVAMVTAILATVGWVLVDERLIVSKTAAPHNIINNGLLPFAVIVAICGGFYLLMKKVFKANNNEAIQALFSLLITSFVVLTIIGIWFRGSGMQLTWTG
jgi:quinol-cytochrome oxidoreductase complex cytochrome b subunit